MLHVAPEDCRIHEERVHVVVSGGTLELLLHLLLGLGKVLGGQAVTRPPLKRLQLALQDRILHLRWEAAMGETHLTASQLDGTLGPVEGLHLLHVLEVLHGDALLKQEEGNVADRLGRRRNLHDVAAPVVHVAVHLEDGIPILGITQGPALSVHVGVLATRNLVIKHACSHGLHAALEDAVHVADKGPVLVQELQLLVVHQCVAWHAHPGGDESVQ
mmetsp:Transcript_67070/g.178642  ORF Transcript_67070/g.178642 Transcript_67070/m.178642 type:complete len:216 (+) Transcript_67070:783-1430(+)